MFIHIGYGNYINKDELKLMSSQFTTGYYSRLIKNAKMKNNYEGIDFTNGHSKKTFILLNNNNFVYSAIPYSQLMTRYKKCNTFGNKIISLGNKCKTNKIYIWKYKIKTYFKTIKNC